jgi:PAS domain S-box
MLKKMQAAVEQSPSIVIISDATGIIEYVNPKFLKVSGYGRDEIVGTHMYQVAAGHVGQDRIDEIVSVLKSGGEWQGELQNLKKSGESYWVSTHVSPLRDESGLITHFIDVEEVITEHKLADDRLIASLNEKEVLLKEIHHRVKNNLQIICSLLNLQSGYIADGHDLAVFRECQDRVKSMAMIHELMCNSRDIGHIDLEAYIHSLLDYLRVSYAVRQTIATRVRARDKIYLNANMAVPCGLILNELITNCIKYAFTGCERGEISVELVKTGRTITMTVSDNGVGLPYGYDPAGTGTLGMQLIHDLTAQIGGSLQIDRSGGTRFRIEFVEK